MGTQKPLNLGNLFFSFHGRISRKVWWLSQIGLWVFSCITLLIYHRFGFHDAIFGGIATLTLFVIRLMLNIKRLHDRGKSAWWVLLLEIPVVGWIWGFIELGCLSGDENENKYGGTP